MPPPPHLHPQVQRAAEGVPAGQGRAGGVLQDEPAAGPPLQSIQGVGASAELPGGGGQGEGGGIRGAGASAALPGGGSGVPGN